MLARGLLCRLAADVSKTSSHDLPQLSRLLQRAVAARNIVSTPLTSGLFHGYKATWTDGRRTVTTTKKPAAKKPAAKRTVKKKTTAKASTSKGKKAKAKPARKTKKATKPKKVAKPKTRKPAPTEKQLEAKKKRELALKVKSLKALALEPPQHVLTTAWNSFVKDKSTGKKGLSDLKIEHKEYANLSPAEREHYNHLANQETAARKAAYAAWVKQYTPDQIRIANNARAALTRLAKAKIIRKSLFSLRPIADDRQVKRAPSPFSLFVRERFASGDFKGLKPQESVKLLSEEWKALSDAEKKKYHDASLAARTTYKQQYDSTYTNTSAATV